MNEWNNPLYGNYRNRKFCDIFPTASDFTTAVAAGFASASLTSTNQVALYYLLYARFGNSTIACSDENQFQYKIFALIFQHGPTWQRKLALQNSIRLLTDNELITGAVTVNNHVLNPGKTLTSASEILQAVDDQTAQFYNRSKLDAYSVLNGLLEDDVTEGFISRFADLFIKIVEPEVPLWYVTDQEDE